MVLRLMEGLPDTGSHPAQMGIRVNYNEGVPREDCKVCVGGKQTFRGLARVGLNDACGETETRCYQFDEENSQSKLSQGMWEVFAR